MSNPLMDEITFNADGLIAAIAQCVDTGQVLMLAWMNAEALALTLETKQVTYFSRSRQALWRKGETSGHTQELISAHLDCDVMGCFLKSNRLVLPATRGRRVAFLGI